ncbi:MAG: glycosyltransferase family 1 protein [candidate division WOR-3 bacterium]
MHLGIDAAAFRIPSAGIARYTLNITTSLAELIPDLEVSFYSPGPIRAELPDPAWRTRVANSRFGQPVAWWLHKTLPEQLAEDRVDVFWGHNHELPLRLRTRCWRMLTLHDLTSMVFPHLMPLGARLAARLFLRRAVAAADLVLTDSAATAHLAVRLGLKMKRQQTVYPGLEQRFQPVPGHSVQKISQQYQLPEQYLLTVGTIEPRKNHMTLFRALERLPHAPLLVVVGSIGWQCARVVPALRRLEAAGRVRYLGRVPDEDMPGIYSAALLFVYPTIYEGFGLPVLEAMACGCPVLCSWTSSLTEVAGPAAEYFPAEQDEILAAQISRLVADKPQRQKMADLGRKRARLFRTGAAARAVLAELGVVMGKKAGSACRSLPAGRFVTSQVCGSGSECAA